MPAYTSAGMLHPEEPDRPVTGYPFGSAPPPPNPYYSNYQYVPDSSRRATCLRRITVSVITLLIIFAFATFLIWLVIRPRLPDFRVDSFSISNFTIGDDSLVNFISEIRLTAQNPNRKMSLVYDHIDAAILYKSDALSDATGTPFSQAAGNETHVTEIFAAAESFVERRVSEGMKEERARNGSVNFNVRIGSWVRFEAKGWRTWTRFLKVFCRDLIVSIPSNGKSGSLTGGGPRRCGVGI